VAVTLRSSLDQIDALEVTDNDTVGCGNGDATTDVLHDLHCVPQSTLAAFLIIIWCSFEAQIYDSCGTQFSISKHVAKFCIEKADEYVTKKFTRSRSFSPSKTGSIIDAVGYAAPDISVITSIKDIKLQSCQQQ